MSPSASYAIDPLAARPYGAGQARLGSRRTTATIAASRTTSERDSTASRRHGNRVRRGPRSHKFHGEPPFDGCPGGSLTRAGGPPEDVCEVIGRPRRQHRSVRATGRSTFEASRSSVMRDRPSGDSDRIHGVDRWPRLRGASRRARGAAGISRYPSGMPMHGRHVRQWHPEEVMQDDDRAPCPGSRVRERAIEQVAVDDATAEIARSTGLGAESAPPRSTRRLRRRIRSRQALTSSRWSQASNRSTSRNVGRSRQAPDESLLDRVPCEVGVPEDQAGGRVQARDGCASASVGEGVMIAPPRSLDETSLVHGRLWMSARPMAAVLDILGRHRCPESFPCIDGASCISGARRCQAALPVAVHGAGRDSCRSVGRPGYCRRAAARVRRVSRGARVVG